MQDSIGVILRQQPDKVRRLDVNKEKAKDCWDCWTIRAYNNETKTIQKRRVCVSYSIRL